MDETDFTTLLSQARRGDTAAFAELVRRYESEVRIIARVLLGPAMRPYLDSHDIVQSVHRSLWRNLRSDRFTIDEPGQLVALAVEMARRKVAHQWRRLKRQERVAGDADGDARLPDFLASLVSPELGPARVAQINEAVARMNDELSEADRKLMELRMQGYSTVEAARAFAVDPDVLRVRPSIPTCSAFA